MLILNNFILFVASILCSDTFAAIHDEEYINKHGPIGLIPFKKNDSFIDWVRVPEIHYQQWIYALKLWRTLSIVLGIFCLIFASLVLAYIIHGFRTNSIDSLDPIENVKSYEQLVLPSRNLPANLRILALQHQLKLVQQRERETSRQKYEIERHLPNVLKHPTSSVVFTKQL